MYNITPCDHWSSETKYRVIPRVIFTDPQVAVAGQTDEVVVGSGVRRWCGTIPVEYVPRAGATHQADGIAKIVIDRDTEEVKDVSLVTPNAGEVIHEAAMAMCFHAKLYDFIDMIHVYPTMAEALKIAAISYFKDTRQVVVPRGVKSESDVLTFIGEKEITMKSTNTIERARPIGRRVGHIQYYPILFHLSLPANL